MASRHSSTERRRPIYEATADILARNIENGVLYERLVLLEGPLSELLQVSRNSVRRALAQLEAEDRIHRFEGRGYLVGSGDGQVQPKRDDLREIELDQQECRPPLSTQQQIYADMERGILGCLVFGRYRLIETELAAHFHVSRTVIRDVLGRLLERGLVLKSSTSRWLTAPLTARAIKNKFDLRKVLEVAAIDAAADHLDLAALDILSERMERMETGSKPIEADHWFALSDGFMEILSAATPNVELRELMLRNYRTLVALQRVLFSLGLHGDQSSIRELRIVVELLTIGSKGGAAELHRNHLNKSRERTIAQLKIVSILPEPDHLASWLVPARDVPLDAGLDP